MASHLTTIAHSYGVSVGVLLNLCADKTPALKRARRMLAWYYYQMLGLGLIEVSLLTGLSTSNAQYAITKINALRSARDKEIAHLTDSLCKPK